VQRKQPRGDAMVGKQPAGGARVLRRHGIHVAQHIKRPQGYVTQIPNRGGHYI